MSAAGVPAAREGERKAAAGRENKDPADPPLSSAAAGGAPAAPRARAAPTDARAVIPGLKGKFSSASVRASAFPVAGRFHFPDQYSAVVSWNQRAHGVQAPKIYVGQQSVVRSIPQQMMPFQRYNLTVAPDMSDRGNIPKQDATDEIIYKGLSTGATLSVRPWAVVFTTGRLQARSARRQTHDVRSEVTMNPADLPASELATIVPLGIATGGAVVDAFAPDAKQKSVTIPMSITGLLTDVNRSGVRIPAGTPIGYFLPEQCVASDEELKEVEKGGRPVPKWVMNHVNNGTLELMPQPIAQDICERLNQLDHPHQQLLRAGFMVPPEHPDAIALVYNEKAYDPEACFNILTTAVCTPTDAVHVPLQVSEGVEALIAYRLLCAVAVFAGAGGLADDERMMDQLAVSAASGRITLKAFVQGQRGKDGSVTNGVLHYLREAKTRVAKRDAVLGAELVSRIERTAVGGLSSASRIHNLAQDQIDSQIRGAIFGVAVQHSLPGSDLVYVKT